MNKTDKKVFFLLIELAHTAQGRWYNVKKCACVRVCALVWCLFGARATRLAVAIDGGGLR